MEKRTMLIHSNIHNSRFVTLAHPELEPQCRWQHTETIPREMEMCSDHSHGSHRSSATLSGWADNSPLFVSDLLCFAFRTILDINMRLSLSVFVVFNLGHRVPDIPHTNHSKIPH